MENINKIITKVWFNRCSEKSLNNLKVSGYKFPSQITMTIKELPQPYTWDTLMSERANSFL